MEDWIPTISALIGAAVGGISTYFATIKVEERKSKHLGRSVQSALVTEIEAILEITNQRGYQQSFQQIIQYLKANPGAAYTIQVKVPGHYSRIYQENAGKIGTISNELASNIVKFHQFVDSVVQDITPGGVLYSGGNLSNYTQTKTILDTAILLGQKIIDDHRKIA